MRKFFCLLVLVILTSCGENTRTTVSLNSGGTDGGRAKITIQSLLSQAERGAYRKGEVLVKFRPGILASASLRSHQSAGARVERRLALVTGLEHVRLPEGVTVKEAIMRYMSDPDVEYAEPNYIRNATVTVPNDTLFGQQWALRNTGQVAGGVPGADIRATQAWDLTRGSRSVIVAVLDSGIDYTHPDLQANIWSNPGEANCTDGIDNDGNGFIDDCRGWDFVNADNDPLDDLGHGTHVSGIIGAVGNNVIGVAGMMWEVQVMPLKIIDTNGEGSVADEIAAVSYAISKGTRVVNASFGGSQFTNAEFDAMAAARNAGVLVVAASGNDGNLSAGNNDVIPVYPANYPLTNIISVAATDQTDRRASFSNFGPRTVHVAAPGVFILSTYPLGYEILSGTSMSVGYVSGLAGLLHSQYVGFSHAQIRGMILKYVDVLPTIQGSIFSGGRINAERAVASLLAPSNFSADLSAPGRAVLTWKDNSLGEDGFRMERSTGDGGFTEISRVGENTTDFTDSTVTDGATSTYRIRAFAVLPAPPDSSPVNADSTPVDISVTVPFASPTGLAASALSSSQVRLTWNDNSRSETAYKIDRRTGADSFAQIATVSANETAFTDSALSPSTTYAYRVRAFSNSLGDTSYSNEAVVTTRQATGGGDSGGGGGGGCAIAARQQDDAVDPVIILILFVFLVLGARRSGRV